MQDIQQLIVNIVLWKGGIDAFLEKGGSNGIPSSSSVKCSTGSLC